MYKTELVRKVAQKTKVSRKVASRVIDASLETIQETLGKRQMVQIPGFGAFYTRQRAASRVRDFKTGQPRRIPRMPVAAFRAGAVLKRAVRKKK
jgi:DNA-binding protein HU-beta